MTDLAGFVLAAGSGTRLRPLTDIRPKALCPINNVPLVDIAIRRLEEFTSDITVNAWHHSGQMAAHLDGRARLSIESPLPMETAGALGVQRDWIDGRPVLLHNADAYSKADITQFVSEWDGERVRLLVVEDPERGDFGPWRFCGISLLPWSEVKNFEPEPSGLWSACWERLHLAGQLDLVPYDGSYFDCGTPADYLDANLAASGGVSVVGAGAVIDGEIERCVIWPDARVEPHERLVDVVRATSGITVDARRTSAVE